MTEEAFDWRTDSTTQDEYEEERKKAGRQAGEEPRLRLYSFTEITPILTGFSLVSGLLAPGQVSVFFGAPGVGKTFLALDIALHIAKGEDWFGRRVTQGIVIYIAAEAGKGIFNRAYAWRLHKKLMTVTDDEVSIKFLPMQIDLRRADGDIDDLITTIRESCGDGNCPVFIVIDTLNRVLSGGNESSGEDMGGVITSAFRLRDEFGGCHVCILHHPGKDESHGLRGHSSLHGDIDTEIEIVANEGTELSTATVVKQRDGETGEEISFKLLQVFIGKNEFGEDVTSCVVDSPDEVDIAQKDQVKAESALSTATKKALDALTAAINEHGLTPSGDIEGMPPGARCVREYQWREYCNRLKVSAGEKQAQRQAFIRARKALLERKMVGVSGDWVWLN